MSDTPQRPDWWRASDGKWYPPIPGSSQPLPPPPQESRSDRKSRKQRAQVQALLEPGEQIQALFVSQTGPSPRGPFSVGMTSNLMRYWSVALTDRNIVLCPIGLKGSPRRLPREPFAMPEGPSRKWWFEVTIGGKRHFVGREQFDIVAAANESLRAEQGTPVPDVATEPTASAPDQPSATPANWYPDPTSRHQQRYWDGQEWTPFVADQGTQSSDPLAAA